MNMDTLRGALLGSVFLVSLCTAVDPVPRPRPAETLREFNEKRNGTIVVEGSVVDGEGNPLADVTAHIDRFIASGIEGESLQSKEKISGVLSLRFVGNSNVQVTFRRKAQGTGFLWQISKWLT